MPNDLGVATVTHELAPLLLLTLVKTAVGRPGVRLVHEVVAVSPRAPVGTHGAAVPGGGGQCLPRRCVEVDDGGGHLVNEGTIVRGEQDRSGP